MHVTPSASLSSRRGPPTDTRPACSRILATTLSWMFLCSSRRDVALVCNKETKKKEARECGVNWLGYGVHFLL